MILNKQVGLFLNLVHNRFKQYVTVIFEEHGFNITPEQFLVMDTLWDEGVLTQQQIADYLLKDKNSVVKLVDGLEDRKLVRRVSNPKDRRQNLIEVANIFRAKIVDIGMHSMIIEVTGAKRKLDAFLNMLGDFEILEIARTGLTGLSRGIEDVHYL